MRCCFHPRVERLENRNVPGRTVLGDLWTESLPLLAPLLDGTGSLPVTALIRRQTSPHIRPASTPGPAAETSPGARSPHEAPQPNPEALMPRGRPTTEPGARVNFLPARPAPADGLDDLGLPGRHHSVPVPGGLAWTPLTRVSFDYGGSTLSGSPSIAVSPATGLPYVAFQANWNPRDGNAYVIGFARPDVNPDGSLDWSAARQAPTEATPRAHKNVGPSLAVGTTPDGAEQIHIVYWEHLGSEDLLYVRSDDGGATWTPPLNLSNTGKVLGTSSVAADDQGNVFVAWSDWAGNRDANGLDIWYRKFDGAAGAWEPKMKIETNPATKSSYPKLFWQPGGGLHVAWADRLAQPAPYLSYSASFDGGETFSPPEVALTVPVGKDLASATVAAGADGTVYVAGNAPPANGSGTNYTWYSSKEPDGTWAPAYRVWDSHPSANPWFTADQSGRVYLSWLRYANNQYDILFKYRDGTDARLWQDPPPQNVTQDGLWKGYTGGQIAVDVTQPAPTAVYLATDDTPTGRHQIYVSSLDMKG